MDSTPIAPAAAGSSLGTRLQVQVDALTTELLRQRSEEGPWRGHLSSSAFATAMSLAALYGSAGTESGSRRNPVERASQWLTRYRNADGGWGDTPAHASSARSTLAVYLAMVSHPSLQKAHATLIQEASQWLDRTSIAARLGTGPRSWTELLLQETIGHGKTSTFPLAALSCFVQRGDLSTGSRSSLAQTFQIERWNSAVANSKDPFSSVLRNVGRRPSPWDRLFRGGHAGPSYSELQLANGSLLDSPSITSACVLATDPRDGLSTEWLAKAIDFLDRSQRPDGSWPLDMSFSTRCTALAIEAIPANVMGPINRERTRDWLRRQQFRAPHPLSKTPPGGWSWTSPPSGIPNVEDTTLVLLALKKLGPTDVPTLQSATDGCEWLVKSQATILPRSTHAQRALQSWAPELPEPLRAAIAQIYPTPTQGEAPAMPSLPDPGSLVESAQWLESVHSAREAARGQGQALPPLPKDYGQVLEEVLKKVERGEWRTVSKATFHGCGFWTCEEKEALLLVLNALSHARAN